jgi:predicted RNA-binding protein
MCQTNVFMMKEGTEELLLENVTTLEVQENGLKIASLFEGTRVVEGAMIKKIDFSGGKVYLVKSTQG